MKLLPVGTIARQFCSPCGDKSAVAEIVRSANIETIADDPDGDYFVKFDGKQVDLAYTFVMPGGATGWSNLAFLTKCADYQGSGDEMPAAIEVR